MRRLTNVAPGRATLAAALEPGYTIPEWAEIDPALAQLVDGDIELAPGVRALLTPGHAPGHQSIVIDAADGCIVIAAQCIFRASAFTGGVEEKNLHDPSWRDAAAESLNRLRACAPTQVLLSHDVLSTR